LGPVATLLGLAFRVYDPDKLVGDKEDIGITCALIPTSHPGVEIGRRHMPLNAVFQNGPNSGKDVFIPMDWVIGGRPCQHGGCMLSWNLAAGRGISLPSSNTGMSMLAAHGRRLCARAHAVQDGDRQVRGRRGAARAYGRQPVHDRCHANGHGGRR
jgi:acyl-CoA dehydrogenase